MIKMIRRKRLFEEGEQNTQQQQAPVQGNQQQAQNNAQQPAQNNGNQQQQNADQNNGNQQQNNNQQEQQQEQNPQQQKIAEEVNKFLGDFKAQWEKNDIFWALSFNLPDALSQAVPEFKQDNADAKAGIDAWNTFKGAPSKENFDNFLNALTQFATGSQQQQDASQQAVNNNQQNESYAMTFGEKLRNRLMEEKRTEHLRRLVEDGYHKLG